MTMLDYVRGLYGGAFADLDDNELQRIIGDDFLALNLAVRHENPDSAVRWYLAGPMTGIEDHNYPAFTAACEHLRNHGYRVVSPHEEHAGDTGREWEWYLAHDLRLLLDCGGIILLPGWEGSRGARLERTVAEGLGYPIRMFDEL